MRSLAHKGKSKLQSYDYFREQDYVILFSFAEEVDKRGHKSHLISNCLVQSLIISSLILLICNFTIYFILFLSALKKFFLLK